MNKSDYLLVFVLLLISFSFIFIKNEKAREAIVYYENKEVLKIDMSIDKEYTVSGYNGDVVIEVKDSKIRIKKETSPNNICSKMGFIDKSYESLVCLPNKIIVKIVATDELDAVVK